MHTQLQLEKALQIAIRAHAGQRDKAGRPYILHPLRVMISLKKNSARVTALLHDVVEDSSVTTSMLEKMGFTKQVIRAVDLLTRKPGQAYEDYIICLARNTLAREVKRADLADNLAQTDLLPMTERHRKCIKKYKLALRYLTDM